MKLYTLQEVAQMTGVSMRLAHKYLSEGILEGAKYGNAWRISEKQLEEFHERMTSYSMQRRRHTTGTDRAAFFGEEVDGADDGASVEDGGVPLDAVESTDGTEEVSEEERQA